MSDADTLNQMRIKHFEEADTALLEFSSTTPTVTEEVVEDIFVDFDERSRVVNITIEHIRQPSNMRELAYERIPENGAL